MDSFSRSGVIYGLLRKENLNNSDDESHHSPQRQRAWQTCPHAWAQRRKESMSLEGEWSSRVIEAGEGGQGLVRWHKSKMSTCCLSSGKVICEVCWHSVGFPWKESSSKWAAQGGVDKLRWLQPRGRRRGSGLAIIYCFVSSQSASEPVTVTVCVVVVVVKVAGSTQSWFSV